jgi:hypothetical protein
VLETSSESSISSARDRLVRSCVESAGKEIPDLIDPEITEPKRCAVEETSPLARDTKTTPFKVPVEKRSLDAIGNAIGNSFSAKDKQATGETPIALPSSTSTKEDVEVSMTEAQPALEFDSISESCTIVGNYKKIDWQFERLFDRTLTDSPQNSFGVPEKVDYNIVGSTKPDSGSPVNFDPNSTAVYYDVEEHDELLARSRNSLGRKETSVYVISSDEEADRQPDKRGSIGRQFLSYRCRKSQLAESNNQLNDTLGYLETLETKYDLPSTSVVRTTPRKSREPLGPDEEANREFENRKVNDDTLGYLDRLKVDYGLPTPSKPQTEVTETPKKAQTDRSPIAIDSDEEAEQQFQAGKNNDDTLDYLNRIKKDYSLKTPKAATPTKPEKENSPVDEIDSQIAKLNANPLFKSVDATTSNQNSDSILAPLNAIRPKEKIDYFGGRMVELAAKKVYTHPNPKIEIDLDCPQESPNFTTWTNEEIERETFKNGLKRMKRELAIRALTYIWDRTHPVVEPVSLQAMKATPKEAEIDPLLVQMTLDKMDESLVLSSKPRKKIDWCSVPLNVAFCNFMVAEPQIWKEVQQAKPIDLLALQDYFKKQGHQYTLADLKAYLDKRSIKYFQNAAEDGKRKRKT